MLWGIKSNEMIIVKSFSFGIFIILIEHEPLCLPGLCGDPQRLS